MLGTAIWQYGRGPPAHAGMCFDLRFTAHGGRCRAAAEDRRMPERRWRVTTEPRRGLFLIEIDDGQGFRPATTAEVNSALRQRELFGAADYPTAKDVDARLGSGSPNQRIPRPAGLDGHRKE